MCATDRGRPGVVLVTDVELSGLGVTWLAARHHHWLGGFTLMGRQAIITTYGCACRGITVICPRLLHAREGPDCSTVEKEGGRADLNYTGVTTGSMLLKECVGGHPRPQADNNDTEKRHGKLVNAPPPQLGRGSGGQRVAIGQNPSKD